MPRSKKILFAVISILIIFTLLCSFRFTADELKPVQHWDYEQIKNQSTNIGYRVKTDPATGLDVYSNLFKISHILLPHDGSDFDIVVVKLNSPIKPHESKKDPLKPEEDTVPIETQAPRLYYNIDESGYFVPLNYCNSVYVDAGSTMDAESTLVFHTAFPKDKNVIALNIDGEFSIDYVTAYEVTGKTVVREFNIIAFACFLVILLFTLLFEKKIGFFSFLISNYKKRILLLKDLFSCDRIHFAIHLSALLSTTILIVTVISLVMLGYFTKVTIFCVFGLGVISTVLQLLDRLKYGAGSKVPQLFMTVALLIGITFCYTSPITTHSSWDDEAHFSNSYMSVVRENNDQSLAEAKLFSYQYNVEDYLSNPNHFVRLMTEESEIYTEYDHHSGNAYTHISYSPMILVIALAKLLAVDMAKILVLCRFANMLAFVFISYISIKKLKSGALIFSAICLLPCILYLSCSIGYDFWLIAWILYCFAYIISLIQQPDKKITPVDCAKILLAFFIGCSAKALYCVLMLPLLFIGKDKFEKPRHARIFRVLTVITVIVILSILVLPGIFSFNFYADSRGGDNISPIGQFIYVITHPFQFARALFTHMEELCSFKRFNTYSATFGYLDGYDGSNQLLYGTVALIIVVFCIFADRSDDDNYELPLMQKIRWITYLACFLQVVVICGSMYAAFNNVGSPIIAGTQFRYLFPMLAPLSFFFFPIGMKCYMSQKKKLTLVFGIISANIFIGYFTTYLWKFIAY